MSAMAETGLIVFMVVLVGLFAGPIGRAVARWIIYSATHYKFEACRSRLDDLSRQMSRVIELLEERQEVRSKTIQGPPDAIVAESTVRRSLD
jgi:hypothetical protein